MKTKLLFLAVFVLFSTLSFAQSDRESLSLIRVNGTYSAFASGKRATNSENGKLGYSIELGGKAFLSNSNGLFIEGTGQFFWTHLPFNTALVGGGNTGYIIGQDYLRECGFGIKGVFGYDFILNNYLSLEVFSGPIVNLTVNYGPSNNTWDYKHYLNRFNYRWQAGVGLNFKQFGVNATFTDDLVNRGKHHHTYRTYMISLGIAYHFSISGK